MSKLDVLRQRYWCRKTVEQTPEISFPALAPDLLLCSLVSRIFARRLGKSGYTGLQLKPCGKETASTRSKKPEQPRALEDGLINRPARTRTRSHSTGEHTQQQVCVRAPVLTSRKFRICVANIFPVFIHVGQDPALSHFIILWTSKPYLKKVLLHLNVTKQRNKQ